MLPNLLIIGAMKSATTSLHEYLNAHPSIYMSDEKEIDFFNTEENFKRGLAWYEQYFPEKIDVKIYGESSTSYTKYPYFYGVPERINQTIPDVKMIYILRDPIARIISHYHMMVLRGEEVQSFETIVSDLDGFYVQNSRYHMQLQQYLQYFSIDQIHMLTMESLNTDSETELDKIYAFLGVETLINATQISRKYNTATPTGLNSVGRVARRLLLEQNSPIRQFLLPLIPKQLRTNMRNRIFNIMRKEMKKPVLTHEQRQRLETYLKPDVDALRELTGYAFDEWSL